MKEEFLSKINSSKYISNLLYTNIKTEFPNIIPTDFDIDKHNEFWLKMLFKNKKEIEKIAYAEERRLFYVALTRTKNYVFLIANKDSRYRSSFINEIYDITKEEVSV